MKDETLAAFHEAQKRLNVVQRQRLLTYGPDAVRFLIQLFDAVAKEVYTAQGGGPMNIPNGPMSVDYQVPG